MTVRVTGKAREIMVKFGGKELVDMVEKYTTNSQHFLDTLNGSAEDWIWSAFTWEDAEEGHKYWSDLVKKLREFEINGIL